MTAPIRIGANQPGDRFYRGGARIRDFRGSGAAGDRVPEDWVASTTPLFGEQRLGLTVIGDEPLRDLISTDAAGWLGADHVARFGTSTALLVKLLDAGERLPVHLHPDREFALEHLDSPFGKTEAWIALEPVTAKVGFRVSPSVSEVSRWVTEQDVDAMLGAMTDVHVPAGASIVVPAGVPHAIGEGAFVVELQEPTDFSVLMEWRDFEIDGIVAGHLGLGFDTALAALDRSAWTPERVATLVTTGDTLAPAADGYFRAERLRGGATLDPGFSVLIVVSGEGMLGDVTVVAGETWVVPYSAGALELTGTLELIRCRPPAAVVE